LGNSSNCSIIISILWEKTVKVFFQFFDKNKNWTKERKKPIFRSENFYANWRWNLDLKKVIFFAKFFSWFFFCFHFLLFSSSLSLSPLSLTPLSLSLSSHSHLSLFHFPLTHTSLSLSQDDVVCEVKSKGSSAASGKSVGGKKKWNLHQNLPKKEKKRRQLREKIA